jgi:hypothetical protein
MTGSASVGYSTTISSNPIDVPNRHAINLGRGEIVHLADATNDESQYNYLTVVITPHQDYKGSISESPGQVAEDCVFFAPAAKYLKFNVKDAPLDDLCDTIILFHEAVKISYDRAIECDRSMPLLNSRGGIL